LPKPPRCSLQIYLSEPPNFFPPLFVFSPHRRRIAGNHCPYGRTKIVYNPCTLQRELSRLRRLEIYFHRQQFASHLMNVNQHAICHFWFLPPRFGASVYEECLWGNHEGIRLALVRFNNGSGWSHSRQMPRDRCQSCSSGLSHYRAMLLISSLSIFGIRDPVPLPTCRECGLSILAFGCTCTLGIVTITALVPIRRNGCDHLS